MTKKNNNKDSVGSIRAHKSTIERLKRLCPLGVSLESVIISLLDMSEEKILEAKKQQLEVLIQSVEERKEEQELKKEEEKLTKVLEGGRQVRAEKIPEDVKKALTELKNRRREEVKKARESQLEE